MPEVVRDKSRITTRDFDTIAEEITQIQSERASDRKDLEKCWKEIDRQIAMEPERRHKQLPNGKIDAKKNWMTESETPLQAQTQEVLTADARRMIEADPWFQAHAETTDEYLNRVDMQSLVLGDENDVPSVITQDNADKLVEGTLAHWHRQQDFWGSIDRMNMEALTYGSGPGRAMLLTKEAFMETARGVVRKDLKMPVLVPRSIKKTYLDTTSNFVMNEGHMVSPSTIYCEEKKLTDVQMMARKGSTNPKNFNGGWMPKALKDVEGDKNGNVRMMEYEGDLIIKRKTRENIFLPNVIVTVVSGKNGDKPMRKVIRLRFVKWAFQPSIVFSYHHDKCDSPYASSPLMKGRPIAVLIADAINKLADSGALKVAPPIGWDDTSKAFGQSGGPHIHPFAQWQGLDEVKVYDEVGGDPQALQSVLLVLIQWYSDVTGVNAPRLGAQTVSHTTAFAKDVELSRGQSRTVDYVRDVMAGPLTKWLYMAYEMGRDSFGDRATMPMFIDAYGGWVEVFKDALADRAAFEVFGAGGPAEEQQKTAEMLQALQTALQMDVLRIQTGQPPHINSEAAIEQVLRKGGWTDVESITNASGGAGTPQNAAGGAGANQAAAGPGAAIAALQGLGAQ